jgi:DNA polymerase
VIRCPGCGRVYWTGLLTCPACGALRGPDCKTDWGIEAVNAALVDISTRDLARIESQWGDAVAAVSGCLRGLFAAAPGCEFICSDFSAIEAVVLAELAGEEWRQIVFRTHGKIYEKTASDITGIPFDEILNYKKETGTHHPTRKKYGKIPELAGGFGGGLGAWKAFGAGEFMDDDEIQDKIKAWRRASPLISKFWYGIQDAAFMAVQNPGHCYQYQAPATSCGQPPAIIYGVRDDILYCRLPSGRNLTYHAPRLEPDTDFRGRPSLRLTYMGWNSDYKKGPQAWTRLDTWGGKLTENYVQATARDLLAFSMPPLERAGYPIVLHVHDEIVSEVPAGSGDVAEFERIMSTVPAWAHGWPVKAAGGWRGDRYRKD